MDINGILLAERTSLLRKLKQLNLELKDLPQGQIYFVRNGKNWRWRIRETDKDGKTVRTRLSKSKRSYASELSYRRFLEQNRRSRIFGEITLPAYFHGLSFLPVSRAKDSPFIGISTCSLEMSAQGRGYFLRLFRRTHFCLCRMRNILCPIATQQKRPGIRNHGYAP